MTYQNFVIIEGRAATDFEIKETASKEHRYCNFTICYNKIKKNKAEDGTEWTSEPGYHTVTVWDKTADYCQKLAKGDPISVIGKLDYSNWTDENGKKFSKTFITASAVRKLFIENKTVPQFEEIPETDMNTAFDEPNYEEDYLKFD